MTILQAVLDATDAIRHLFQHARHLSRMLELTDLAVRLGSDSESDDLEAIRMLGEGWVAEETLAIAIYCALKYPHDFEKAVIASVNHSGDSDSTGAVTGNILGAKLGMQAIPEKFLTNLELKETILEIADDLARTPGPDTPDDVWARKYIHHTYSD